MKLTAKTMFGLEPILAKELEDLGAKNIILRKRAVSFTGDLRLMYKANLNLRTALRILVEIDHFEIRGVEDLYNKIKRIDWTKYIERNQTISVDSLVFSRMFEHSGYVSLKTKDAVVDQIREKRKTRPDVDTKNPDVRINVHIADKWCSLSLDSSGDSLNKRGYRLDAGLAPLNEVLAAGILLQTGWNAKQPLYDPMCGSGTLVIEAALMAYNIAPGMYRNIFGFEKWNNFDADIWEDVLDEAEEKEIRKPEQIMVYGSDVSRRAVVNTKRNVENARLQKRVSITHLDFLNSTPPVEEGVIVTNPPYGERIEPKSITELYAKIGQTLKHKYPGYYAWIFSGSSLGFKNLELKHNKSINLMNGGIECRLRKYALFQGKFKDNI